ncbi:MAG: hypothetical protein Q7S48_03135 [bacterium]|nr:hypothetical protein [bacterium]
MNLGNRLGKMSNQNYPIHTLLAKKTFEKQLELEQGSEGMDWKAAYKDLLRMLLTMAIARGYNKDALSLVPEELEKKATRFIHDFNAIDMEDTVYKDIPEALTKLSSIAKEIDIWTTGDIKNSNQQEKLKRSGVIAFLRLVQAECWKAGHELIVNTVLHADKFSEISARLDSFSKGLGNSRPVILVVYDDTVRNFAKVEKEAEEWMRATNRKVARVYIRAKTGRQSEYPAPEGLGITMEVAATLSEAVEVLTRMSDEHGFSRDQVLVLLDFDGALSDNRLMRLRQAHVMYYHVMITVRELVDRAYQWEDPDDVASRKLQIAELYKKISVFWEEQHVSYLN